MVKCARGHLDTNCIPPTADNGFWRCPKRRRISELAPLLNSYNRMSPKAVLMVLYCHIEGMQRKTAKRESECTQKSVAGVIERFEELLAQAHIVRYTRARWSVRHMQKDETCF
eukprot:PhM_4_TR16087/c1_g1_i2/m.38408